MDLLDTYSTFKDYGYKSKPPPGYKKIRVHLVVDVKHDGRHKARLVADGHLTDIPLESVCSGVVSLRGLRLIVFLMALSYGQLMWDLPISKQKRKSAYTSKPDLDSEIVWDTLLSSSRLCRDYGCQDYAGMNDSPPASGR